MICRPTDRNLRAVARERPDPMSVFASRRTAVDPGWTGITEVLVSGLGGVVRWEPGSVVLHLPDQPQSDRVADLDALKLCLIRIGVPVVLDDSRVTPPDASLVDFLRKLVESGLMVNRLLAA